MCDTAAVQPRADVPDHAGRRREPSGGRHERDRDPCAQPVADSSDFTLIPTVSATFAGCSVDADCNDGVSCTTDTCVSSTCVHTSNCLAGQTCNLGTGVCEVVPVTATFQDGTGGYGGTQDTYLAQAAPTTVEGALTTWRWDTENPVPSQEFGLIRFDNIIGVGVGQIPAGSTIQTATLTLEVTDASVAPNGSVNESTVDWAEATETWNTFGGEAGVQADEYLASPQYVAPIATGSQGIDVTTSVQAWASSLRSNFGWVFRPASNNGTVVNSAEFATVNLRPKLTVVYVFGCSTNPQCDDGNACNGLETCVTGQCQTGTPLDCTDSNPCTTDSCNPGSGCQFVNNTLAVQRRLRPARRATSARVEAAWALRSAATTAWPALRTPVSRVPGASTRPTVRAEARAISARESARKVGWNARRPRFPPGRARRRA